MSKGLFFYKLISPYIEDVTKNCKLSVNEIDSNFLTLKDEDIKEVKLSEDNTALILVKNDGEEISTLLPDFTSGLDFEWNEEEGQIIIRYNNQETVIDGILTEESGIVKNVAHDSTLRGDGSEKNPMGISLTDKTGMYAPVKAIIDMTEGETLPENPTIGDRYITCELMSDYGYLYNYNAVNEIIDNLKGQASEWRVPSKKDWDTLLNSIEPCDYQNHNDESCHVMLGKYAGVKLKSKEDWKPYIIPDSTTPDGLEELALQSGGIDLYGFKVLPTGEGNEEGKTDFYQEKAAFWSTSHIKTPEHQEESGDPTQDIYIKIFDYRKTGVIQEAECPERYFGVRLVKDYDGSNFKNVEVINGVPYKAVLFGDINQVWLAMNYAYPSTSGKITPNSGQTLDNKKKFFISVFNGTHWEKKEFAHGDSIVVNNGKVYENEEYRVFLDADGNQILLEVDGVIYERIMAVIRPLIEAEAAAREAADTQLTNDLDAETNARETKDNELTDRINTEEEARIAKDDELEAAINAEAASREQKDTELENALNNEINDRINSDTELDNKINEEISTRENEVNDLNAGLSAETENRISADTQLTNAISAETQDRIARDEELTTALAEEAATRQEVDNLQWAQIIDNPKQKENPATPSEYVITLNGEDEANMTLFSKGGTNDIDLFVDSNYGEL